MGCSSSKLPFTDITDIDNELFKVTILNTRGHNSSTGRIEITCRELILHRVDCQTIRWPLTSIRHYGFNEDFFSFESGRRCPTGVGVYAFRCSRAEALFNCLQERILSAAALHSRRSAMNQAAILARFHTGAISNASDVSDATEQSYAFNAYVNTAHDYANEAINYADLDLPACGVVQRTKSSFDSDAIVFNLLDLPDSHLRYVNVPCPSLSVIGRRDHTIVETSAQRRPAVKHRYENVGSARVPCCDEDCRGLRGGDVLGARAPVLRSQSCKTVSARRASRRLSSARSAGAAAQSPAGYAEIDAERTCALNNNKLCQAVMDDDGIRKTRHSVTTTDDVL